MSTSSCFINVKISWECKNFEQLQWHRWFGQRCPALARHEPSWPQCRIKRNFPHGKWNSRCCTRLHSCSLNSAQMVIASQSIPQACKHPYFASRFVFTWYQHHKVRNVRQNMSSTLFSGQYKLEPKNNLASMKHSCNHCKTWIVWVLHSLPQALTSRTGSESPPFHSLYCYSKCFLLSKSISTNEWQNICDLFSPSGKNQNRKIKSQTYDMISFATQLGNFGISQQCSLSVALKFRKHPCTDSADPKNLFYLQPLSCSAKPKSELL